jgi:hypothetical protein
LVLIFFLNIMALLLVVFLIRNPTPHERVVMTGISAYMALNTAGMVWCLGAVLPEPLSTYNPTGFRTSCIGGGQVSRGCSVS